MSKERFSHCYIIHFVCIHVLLNGHVEFQKLLHERPSLLEYLVQAVCAAHRSVFLNKLYTHTLSCMYTLANDVITTHSLSIYVHTYNCKITYLFLFEP